MPDTKKCPYCAEEIKSEAVVCRYCGLDLETGKPVAGQIDGRTKSGCAPYLIGAVVVPLLIIWFYNPGADHNSTPPTPTATPRAEQATAPTRPKHLNQEHARSARRMLGLGVSYQSFMAKLSDAFPVVKRRPPVDGQEARIANCDLVTGHLEIYGADADLTQICLVLAGAPNLPERIHLINAALMTRVILNAVPEWQDQREIARWLVAAQTALSDSATATRTTVGGTSGILFTSPRSETKYVGGKRIELSLVTSLLFLTIQRD